MDNFILSVAVQFPLLVLFIWYNERAEKRNKVERLEIDARYEKERKERDTAWRDWMSAESESRERVRNELHMRMASELQGLARAVSKLVERKDE
jgi:hypothetical protein